MLNNVKIYLVHVFKELLHVFEELIFNLLIINK